MNSPEFSVDFDCPINSPMNPETKCSFWTSPTYSADNSPITEHNEKKLSNAEIRKDANTFEKQQPNSEMSFSLSSLIGVTAPIG